MVLVLDLLRRSEGQEGMLQGYFRKYGVPCRANSGQRYLEVCFKETEVFVAMQSQAGTEERSREAVWVRQNLDPIVKGQNKKDFTGL